LLLLFRFSPPLLSTVAEQPGNPIVYGLYRFYQLSAAAIAAISTFLSSQQLPWPWCWRTEATVQSQPAVVQPAVAVQLSSAAIGILPQSEYQPISSGGCCYYNNYSSAFVKCDDGGPIVGFDHFSARALVIAAGG
jgi:hypothetical protein